MKRESHNHDICITRTQSDFCKSQVSALCAQDAHDFPVYNRSSISGEDKSLLLSSLEKSVQAASDSVLNGICSKNPYLSESKSKILGKGMFDIELPVDSKHLNEKHEVSEVPEMSSHHLHRIPEIARKPFLKYDLNASLHRDFSTTDSLLEETKVSVDLNDPPNFEEEHGCRSVDLVDATGHREILFHDLSGKTNSKFLVFSEQDIHGRENGLSNNGYSESSSFYDRSKTYQPDKDIANSSLSSSTTSLKKSAQVTIGHPILEAESLKMLIENAMLAEDDLCSVKNLRSSIGSDSVSSLLEGSFCNGSKSGSIKEESHPSFKASANWTGGQIDLNVCINEDFLATPCCSPEMKLEVPVTPRKEKHSSTRGEFDDNQVGTHFLKSVQDDGKPSEDLITIVAEALVSISSSVAQNRQKTTASGQSAQAPCESLCWFAEIVSSMADDPETAEIALKSKDVGDSGELLPNYIDDFEIMTLKLKETKVEGCSLTVSNHQEEAVKNVSSPSCQLGKGRVRRGRGKNFQTEILPSLATLSRYEVTEDIQTIGGLMEVASSQSITGVVKTSSRSRASWTRGKRRSCNSSKPTETVIRSIMDQVSSDNELENKERNVIVWENITRRRRGQRYPACNRKIILGQV